MQRAGDVSKFNKILSCCRESKPCIGATIGYWYVTEVFKILTGKLGNLRRVPVLRLLVFVFEQTLVGKSAVMLVVCYRRLGIR